MSEGSEQRRVNPSAGSHVEGAPKRKFSAFISYKHGRASVFARHLERALKSYAKPLLRPPRKIFRDERHMRPGISLPAMIEQALDDSEYLIYLATPEAAQSEWVLGELLRWTVHPQQLPRLIIILLEGEIAIDPVRRTIDWNATTALAAVLAAILLDAPLYLDARSFAFDERLDLDQPEFRRQVNAIVSLFQGLDPNDMLGEEVLQHRRSIRLMRIGVAAMSVMLAAALAAGAMAIVESRRARDEASSAMMRQLAAQSRLALDRGAPELALALAGRSYETRQAQEALGALQDAVMESAQLLAVVKGPDDELQDIGFDPTGRSLGLLSTKGQARLVDLANGKVTATTSVRTDEVMWSLQFPGAGQQVFIGGGEDHLIIWNPARGSAKPLPPLPGQQQINDFAITPDGQQALLNGSGAIHRLDLATERFLSVPLALQRKCRPMEVGCDVRALDVTIDSREVLVVTEGGRMAWWDLKTGALRQTRVGASGTSIAKAGFVPGGQQAYAQGQDGRLTLWTAATGRSQLADLGPFRVLAATRAGPQGLLTREPDGRVRRWDLEARGFVPDGALLRDRTGGLVALAPDGHAMAIASRDGNIRLWALDGPGSVKRWLGSLGVEAPTALDEAPYAAGVQPDGSVATIDAATGHRRQFASVKVRPEAAIALLDEGRRLAAADGRGGMVFAEGARGTFVHSAGPEHRAGIARIVPAGPGRALSIDENGVGVLWDAGTGKRLALINEDLRAQPQPGVSTWPLRDYVVHQRLGLLVHFRDASLFAFDLQRGALRWGPLRLGAARIVEMQRDPDGDSLAVMTADGMACLVALQGGEKTKCFDTGHVGELAVLNLSAAGDRLGIGWQDGSVALWNVTTGQATRMPKPAHQDAGVLANGVRALAFSPDGSRLLSVGGDGRVLFWSTESGQLLASDSQRPGDALVFAGFLRDGRRAVTVDVSTRALQVWDSASGTAIGQPIELRHSPSLNRPKVRIEGDRVLILADGELMSLDFAIPGWLERATALGSGLQAGRAR